MAEEIQRLSNAAADEGEDVRSIASLTQYFFQEARTKAVAGTK